jgi:hypothetical protein
VYISTVTDTNSSGVLHVEAVVQTAVTHIDAVNGAWLTL